MASTDQILAKARELGELIAEHEAARKLEKVLKQIESDTDAQRALNDYNRHLQTLAEKQQQGKPIEVAEKHKLEELQRQVVMNPVLRDFQTAQMDYVDLMRKVDEAMTGQTPSAATGAGTAPGTAPGTPPGTPPGSAAGGASPLVNPDIGPGTGQ